MSTEIELKLRLDPKCMRKLAAHPLLAGLTSRKQRLLNTYHDTANLTLRENRIAMRFRKKGPEWLLTVKTAEPGSGGLAVRSEWETAAQPGVFDFSHVDAPKLRSQLDQLKDQLEPVFATDFKRQLWHVPFGDSLIELAIDHGHISAGGRREVICEIELELLSGSIADIFGLARALQKHHILHPAIASKAERGYRLFRNEPSTPFKAKPVAISETQSPVDAFRSIALGCLEHFQRNETGLLAGGEPEFIHQARVALRRLRSAIKLFAPVLPEDFVAVYSQSWKTLAGALGEARNWDVFLEETLPPLLAAFPNNAEILQLRNEAHRRVKNARRAITRLLGVKEYPRLIVEFTSAVYALSDSQPIKLTDFAAERIAAHTRSAKKMAQRYAELSPGERHAMRLRFKKLRYAMEFVMPLLPIRRMKPYLNTLSKLQESLGSINDLVTAGFLINDIQSNKSTSTTHGWIAGREALLVEQLPRTLEAWLAQAKT